MIPATWMFKLAGIAVVALALYGLYWSIDNSGYQRHIAEVREAQAEADRIAAIKLRKLEGERNANMAEINRLRANNHALWLRLPSTVSGCPGTDTIAGSGQLPESAPSGSEQALNEFADACGEQAYQCDAIVESCRVLNDALE